MSMLEKRAAKSKAGVKVEKKRGTRAEGAVVSIEVGGAKTAGSGNGGVFNHDPESTLPEIEPAGAGRPRAHRTSRTASPVSLPAANASGKGRRHRGGGVVQPIDPLDQKSVGPGGNNRGDKPGEPGRPRRRTSVR